jgi:hypothetical protein
MIQAIVLIGLTASLTFAKPVEPGQWHPAVESDGMSNQ